MDLKELMISNHQDLTTRLDLLAPRVTKLEKEQSSQATSLDFLHTEVEDLKKTLRSLLPKNTRLKSL